MLLIMSVLISCKTHLSQTQLLESGTFIRLEKGRCLMGCTESDVIINKDGYIYIMEKTIKLEKSKKCGKIKSGLSKDFWKLVTESDLESLKNNYASGSNDTQLKILTLQLDNKLVKTINYKHGEPQIIRNLEKEINKLLNITPLQSVKNK